MPSGFRVPKLPRFGAPLPEPPQRVRVRASSVHGIPIELQVSPRAAAFTRPGAFLDEPTRRPASFGAFARALEPTTEGLTVDVEAFCAPAAPVVAPNALFLPKIPTPNALPDHAGAPAPSGPAAPPLAPAAPVSSAPPVSGPAPAPTLEELAALAEIRESVFAPPPEKTPAPPASRKEAPAPAPPPPGASMSYAHDVFDRMAPPMAMTFDVGNVSLQRRFSEMDSRLDREGARRARTARVPNGSRSASVDDHSLAQDLASMRWSMASHHGATAPADVLPAPAPAVPEAPVVKKAPAFDAPAAKAPPALEAAPTAPATVSAQVVDVAALIAGDVIVAVEAGKSGAAPVTHTLLFIGDGQAVEAGPTGMQVRPVAQVLTGIQCAIALRNNPAAWSAPAEHATAVLVYVGHLKVPTA